MYISNKHSLYTNQIVLLNRNKQYKSMKYNIVQQNAKSNVIKQYKDKNNYLFNFPWSAPHFALSLLPLSSCPFPLSPYPFLQFLLYSLSPSFLCCWVSLVNAVFYDCWYPLFVEIFVTISKILMQWEVRTLIFLFFIVQGLCFRGHSVNVAIIIWMYLSI